MAGDPRVDIRVAGDEVNFDCTIRPAENEPGSPQYTVQWLTGSTFTTVLQERTLTGQSTIDRLSAATLTSEQRESIVSTGVCESGLLIVMPLLVMSLFVQC